MESYKLVLPEHLNHYGYLFGGNMLKWSDEISWIAASREFPGCKFVTVAMDGVEFKKSVRLGAILRFAVKQSQIGNSSVRYRVEVFCDDIEQGTEEAVFGTTVTFVCLDDKGQKTAITKTCEQRP
jgi:acyl-CoA hydrolase